MPEFDLTAFYSLMEAFDRTGRRLYGDVWRGTEAFARRTGDPQATRDERDRLLSRLKDLARDEPIHAALMVEGAGRETLDEASAALHLIRREREELRKELAAIPDIHDWWVRDHETYLRRRRVETELREAFARGDLLLLVGPQEIVDWRSWSAHDDFRVYFGLSMVRVPFRHAGQRRRGPAFVNKVAFGAWLDRFEVSASGDAGLTPAEKCRLWLEEQARTAKPKERAKVDYRTDALGRFPGLTERAFNMVWAQTVPAAWKEAGRAPKKP